MKFNFGGIKSYLTPEEKTKMESVLNQPITESDENKILNAMEGVEKIIELTGDDINRNGLIDTPFRVVKAYLEYTKGYREDPAEHLKKTFDVDHNELILVKDIEFHSLCEHHFAPFFGVAHVAYIPGEKITGLSKIARLVEGYAKRFQVQERLGNQIADAIYQTLEAKGAMVIIEAKHMCMCSRGIKKSGASTTTITTRGTINKPEVISLL